MLAYESTELLPNPQEYRLGNVSEDSRRSGEDIGRTIQPTQFSKKTNTANFFGGNFLT